MSSFQDNLDNEIKKRQTDETAKSSDSASVDGGASKKKDKNKDKDENHSDIVYKKFSFKFFLTGIALLSSLIIGLMGWAWLKADTTVSTLLKNIPSKTAIVQVVDGSDIKLTMAQPTLTMPEKDTKADQALNAQTPNVQTPKENETKILDPSNLGSKPYQINKSAFTKSTNKPLLSFVIYDLGLSESKTKSIIENMQKEIALSFSPYTQNPKKLTDMAVSDGHEVWITLPLEVKEYPLNDPGPSTLLVNASAEKNQARLDDIIDTTEVNVGFITPPKHVFKKEDANVNPVIKEIFNRGYAIIDGNISHYSFLSQLADMKDYPYNQGHIWLDQNITPLSINQNIRKIVEYGENNKDVIVLLHPYPASIKAVQKFLNSRVSEQFELAPVSAQLKNVK